MTKSEMVRIQNLVKKNAKKAALAELAEKKKKTTRIKENDSVDSTVEANDAHRLFKDMKERDF